MMHRESCNPATREPDYCECGLSQMDARAATIESLLRRIVQRMEEERRNGSELPIAEAELRITHVLSLFVLERLEGSCHGTS